MLQGPVRLVLDWIIAGPLKSCGKKRKFGSGLEPQSICCNDIPARHSRETWGAHHPEPCNPTSWNDTDKRTSTAIILCNCNSATITDGKTAVLFFNDRRPCVQHKRTHWPDSPDASRTRTLVNKELHVFVEALLSNIIMDQSLLLPFPSDALFPRHIDVKLSASFLSEVA